MFSNHGNLLAKTGMPDPTPKSGGNTCRRRFDPCRNTLATGRMVAGARLARRCAEAEAHVRHGPRSGSAHPAAFERNSRLTLNRARGQGWPTEPLPPVIRSLPSLPHNSGRLAEACRSVVPKARCPAPHRTACWVAGPPVGSSSAKWVARGMAKPKAQGGSVQGRHPHACKPASVRRLAPCNRCRAQPPIGLECPCAARVGHRSGPEVIHLFRSSVEMGCQAAGHASSTWSRWRLGQFRQVRTHPEPVAHTRKRQSLVGCGRSRPGRRAVPRHRCQAGSRCVYDCEGGPAPTIPIAMARIPSAKTQPDSTNGSKAETLPCELRRFRNSPRATAGRSTPSSLPGTPGPIPEAPRR